MFETLYLFLIKHKRLILPEIGTISLRIIPAKTEFIDRSVLPPQYSFIFSPRYQPLSNQFFTWLSQVQGISESEAISSFNDFAFQLKSELENGKIIEWNELRICCMNLSMESKIQTENEEMLYSPQVNA